MNTEKLAVKAVKVQLFWILQNQKEAGALETHQLANFPRWNGHIINYIVNVFSYFKWMQNYTPQFWTKVSYISLLLMERSDAYGINPWVRED